MKSTCCRELETFSPSKYIISSWTSLFSEEGSIVSIYRLRLMPIPIYHIDRTYARVLRMGTGRNNPVFYLSFMQTQFFLV